MLNNTQGTAQNLRLIKFTHDELVQRALRWLYGSQACQFAEAEPYGLSEIPDAIGWHWGKSILVECKANRADFRNDRKKHHRIYPELGMGEHRWFLCPKGVIKPNELPEHWGLLYCYPTMIRRIVQAEPLPEFNQTAELRLLAKRASAYKWQRDKAAEKEVLSIEQSPIVIFPVKQPDPIPQRQLMPAANLLL